MCMFICAFKRAASSRSWTFLRRWTRWTCVVATSCPRRGPAPPAPRVCCRPRTLRGRSSSFRAATERGRSAWHPRRRREPALGRSAWHTRGVAASRPSEYPREARQFHAPAWARGPRLEVNRVRRRGAAPKSAALYDLSLGLYAVAAAGSSAARVETSPGSPSCPIPCRFDSSCWCGWPRALSHSSVRAACF